MKCIFAMMDPVLVNTYSVDGETITTYGDRSDIDFWILIMFITSLCSFVFTFIGKYSFATVGENITFNVRREMYTSVLTKHMGWHDDREHSAGVLTGMLSKDV